MAVDGEVHHGGVLPEDLLCAVAVVDIPIHDEHAPSAAAPRRERCQGSTRGDAGVVQQATRVRCISIFLDKNRRYMGNSQPKQPPKRTQRTPYQKPIAHPHSAWWPGGRTTATPERSRPWHTSRVSSAEPPCPARSGRGVN
eukprot:COSAG01_NODE_4768_length_4754_cov_24.235661_4_plen_141_part_00